MMVSTDVGSPVSPFYESASELANPPSRRRTMVRRQILEPRQFNGSSPVSATSPTHGGSPPESATAPYQRTMVCCQSRLPQYAIVGTVLGISTGVVNAVQKAEGTVSPGASTIGRDLASDVVGRGEGMLLQRSSMSLPR